MKTIKRRVFLQLFKCYKNTRHGAGGGTRTHTPLRITDFESVSSANSDIPPYLVSGMGVEPMSLP